MTRVVWDDTGQRRYSTGVDRGMLYTTDAVVPWNGLASVTESPTSSAATEIYLDGDKILNLPDGEDFVATIQAFAAPIEFAACAGRVLLEEGLYATNQPKQTFWFSYRTLYGDDVNALGVNYRVHVVCNALAKVADFTHKTISNSGGATAQSWEITTTPVIIPGLRPTAHFVFDSRLIDEEFLDEIEAILYGDTGSDPRMPTLPELAWFASNGTISEDLVVVDNGDGSWSVTSSIADIVQMLNSNTFQIDSPGVSLSGGTYTVSSP